MHVLLIQATIEDFHVATAAINVLFMLNRELDDERFVFVGEWCELVGKSVKACVL